MSYVNSNGEPKTYEDWIKDIEDLKEQNSLDLQDNRNLRKEIEKLEKQLKDKSKLNDLKMKKIESDYAKLKRVIIDENVSVTLNNKIDTSKKELKNKIDTSNKELNEKIETNRTEVNDKISKVNEQLETIMIKNNGVIYVDEFSKNVKNNDWSDVIEYVFNYAINNNCIEVVFSQKEYIITRPITINKSTTDYKQTSFSIKGCGGKNFTQSFNSTIKAYNIPDCRGAIEILGFKNSFEVSGNITNISIIQDEASCSDLSFCLFLGDCRGVKLSQLRLLGYNDLLIRCGSAPNATSYAHIMTMYEQVAFDTFKYINKDNTIINTKAKHGWAIAYEKMFYDNGYEGYGLDTMNFTTCSFGGTVFCCANNLTFIDCMWLIPGEYKETLDFSTDNRYISKYMNGITLDFSNGLFLYRGKVKMLNCYFENVRKCVYVKPPIDKKYLCYLNMELCHFNGKSDLTGVNYVDSKYVVKWDGESYNSRMRIIDCDVKKPYENAYSDGIVINNGCKELFIDSDIEDNEIIDNYSSNFNICNRFNNVKTIEIDFNATLSSATTTPLLLENTDINSYIADKRYRIKRIELYFDKLLTDLWKVKIYTNTAYIKGYEIGSGNNFDKVIKGINSSIYILDEALNYPNVSRILNKDDTLKINIDRFGNSNSVDIGSVVKAKIYLAY